MPYLNYLLEAIQICLKKASLADRSKNCVIPLAVILVEPQKEDFECESLILPKFIGEKLSILLYGLQTRFR